MLANNIEIFQRRLYSSCARHRANVTLSMGDGTVSLHYRLSLPKRNNAAAPQPRFVDEAGRQLRRMPAVRPDRQKLRLVVNLKN